MILDEKKIKCIELLVSGKYSKTEIAKIIKVDRGSIYLWLDNKQFATELEKYAERIKKYGEVKIKSKLSEYIDQMHILATTAESENVRQSCLQYLIDKTMGRTPTKMEVTTNEDKKDNIIDIDKEIELLDAVDLEPEDVK